MRHRRSWDRPEAHAHRGGRESRSFPARGGPQHGPRARRLRARRARILGGIGVAVIGAAAVLAAALSGTALVAARPPAHASLAKPNPRAEVALQNNVKPRHPRRHHSASHGKARPHPAGTGPTTSTPTSPGSPTTPGSPVPPAVAVPYVRPGTQGYKGSPDALAAYSAADRKVPPGGDCSWSSFQYLDCAATNLTLDHVHIMGGLYWTGCGNLTISNSVIDWQPSQSWFLIQNACQNPDASSTITVTGSTLESGPSVPVYTGGSDIGAISEYTGNVPMIVRNSLIQGFPQGLDPTQQSVISDNEIYVQSASCGGSDCHLDGLFSQGGNGIIYEGNYIVVPSDSTATSAIFFQSTPSSSGNKVIGNFIKGGAYTFFNESSFGVQVENNTFGGAAFGDATNCGGGSCGSIGVWTGNIHVNGSPVRAP
jgi:hypothetical protein